MASEGRHDHAYRQHIDIPQPAADSFSSDHGDLRNVVCSPENVSSLPSRSESLTSNIPSTPAQAANDSNNTFTAHPAISNIPSGPGFLRDVTSPDSSHLRRRPSSIVHDVTHGLLRFPHRGRQRPEHEWTVFGELLGNGEHRGSAASSAIASTLRSRDGLRDALNVSSSHEHRISVSPLVPSVSESPRASEPPLPLPNCGSDDPVSVTDDRLRPQSMTPSPLSERPSSSSSSQSTARPTSPSAKGGKRRFTMPTIPLLYKNILKCSVAYFIGSLFTFSPYLSGFISDLTGYGPGERAPSPSGHMVATIAVYFNPAKTFGGMFEADTFCLMGLLFTAFVSLSSMSMYWFLEVQPGWEWLADSLVILWIGAAMSTIAWMKMWMAKPTFNTACSMMSIILFIVVVKEGGLETLLQVAFIILIGSTISNVVCCVLWPQRATRNLQTTMSKTLDSFSTLLTMITETFLLEEPLLLITQEKLQAATTNHQGSFTALKKNLAEAQSERFFGGPGKVKPSALLEEPEARQHLGLAYEDAVASLNRLGQHLNGLRSGISVQYELVKASRGGRLTLRKSMSKFPVKQVEEAQNGKGKVVISPEDDRSEEETALLQAAADAFGEIIDDLGPPLKALSATCTSTLKRLREVFTNIGGRNEKDLQPDEFHELVDALERALFTFDSTSNHAVIRLYRKGTTSVEESIASLADENSVLQGADSETIFLVYFFFFTLQEFAKELVALVDAMSRICEIQRMNARRKSLKQLLRLPWAFLRGNTPDTLHRRRRRGRRDTLSRRISSFFQPEPTHRGVSFPKITPHAPNTKQTPAREELSLMGRLNQTLWALGARLKEPDIKYAFKVGMATAMLAAPAFFDATRPVFVEYRGEWALISFFVVIAPTIGGTNFMAVHRVLGTLLGAATAVVIWTAFPENPYVLSAFGFFFSLPCFYYIVAQPQYATSARFVLLTYNLTCLYSYNLRQHDISVIDIAFHRASAVIVGVLWAAIVSRYWWPIEARRELSKALGEFCLNIGWLYTRLVAFNSFESEAMIARVQNALADNPTEQTPLLSASETYLNESIIQFMAMELHLQIKLIELQGLLAQTQNEPRLKGPFPVKLYRSMLTSLQTILDQLHSMRCVTSREEWHTTVRRDFIIPTNRQRREMVGNVILYFSTLAAAFRLKSPLPPYLPPAEIARERLVEAIRQLDVVKSRDVKGSRQLLFFAYAMTMQGVIRELDFLGHTLQDAFGVIGESTEAFESLFRDTAYEVV